ncbi:hypothetical protein KFF05_16615 [bacterium SCSIO 12827]|nr:hypothetical protein KFF05_16615 [bacterium SCSIO 12827]
MKSISSIVLGMLFGVAATVGLSAANEVFRPHQIVDRHAFLEKLPPTAQIEYLTGLADAIAYIRPKDAIGEGVSNCLSEANAHKGMIFDAPMMHFVKQAQPDTPVVAVLLDLLRKDCADHLK